MNLNFCRGFLMLVAILSECMAIDIPPSAGSNGNGLLVYPAPKEEALSEDFQLKINGLNAHVWSCRVSAVPFNQWWPGYQRPLDQTELAGFAYWDMKGDVQIEVTYKQSVSEAVVRPLSLGIKPKIEGQVLTFQLKRITPLTVEINGRHHVLHLFPSPEQKEKPKSAPRVCSLQCTYCAPTQENIPMPGPAHTIHFGPGIHDVGTLQLQSGDSVYIDGGAVVYGCLIAFNATNIRIDGRGVLDGSRMEHNNQRGIGGFGCVYFRNCSKVSIEGIVVRDPVFWGITVRDCNDVKMSNLKLVGFWRYNADGIDLWNSGNVLVENCFIRSFDDSLVVRGGTSSISDIRFNQCTLWCDWGIALEIFTANSPNAPTTMDRVTFENIDIIHTTGKAINITHVSQKISNVVYRNINVELDGENLRPQIQKTRDGKYPVVPNDSFCPGLFTIGVRKHRPPGGGGVFSTIDDMLFENISVQGSSNVTSSISVADAESGEIKNVKIKNLKFNRQVIETLQQANITVGAQVNALQIEK